MTLWHYQSLDKHSLVIYSLYTIMLNFEMLQKCLAPSFCPSSFEILSNFLSEQIKNYTEELNSLIV